MKEKSHIRLGFEMMTDEELSEMSFNKIDIDLFRNGLHSIIDILIEILEEDGPLTKPIVHDDKPWFN